MNHINYSKPYLTGLFTVNLRAINRLVIIRTVNEMSTLTMCHLSTPIGPMFSCANDKGICLLDFSDRKNIDAQVKDLEKRLNAVVMPGDNVYLEQLQTELSEYFSGTRKKFSVSLHTLGTKFQLSAWDRLLDIPYAETWSYKQQAAAINNPKAIRAVATANAHNRISIIIPCHRVIATDGGLAGYGGGLDRKKWLLDFEQSNANN